MIKNNLMSFLSYVFLLALSIALNKSVLFTPEIIKVLSNQKVPSNLDITNEMTNMIADSVKNANGHLWLFLMVLLIISLILPFKRFNNILLNFLSVSAIGFFGVIVYMLAPFIFAFSIFVGGLGFILLDFFFRSYIFQLFVMLKNIPIMWQIVIMAFIPTIVFWLGIEIKALVVRIIKTIQKLNESYV